MKNLFSVVRNLTFITITTLIIIPSYGQNNSFKNYKYEHNDAYTKLNFSFDTQPIGP